MSENKEHEHDISKYFLMSLTFLNFIFLKIFKKKKYKEVYKK